MEALNRIEVEHLGVKPSPLRAAMERGSGDGQVFNFTHHVSREAELRSVEKLTGS